MANESLRQVGYLEEVLEHVVFYPRERRREIRVQYIETKTREIKRNRRDNEGGREGRNVLFVDSFISPSRV